MFSIFKIMLYIFNRLPIFHLSCDRTFDSILYYSSDFPLRLSIIYIPLGETKHYLMSYSAETKKLNLLFTLRMIEVQHQRTCEEILELSEKLEQLTQDSEDIKYRIEFLNKRNNDFQNGINNLNNKTNNYISITLVYSGLMAYALQQLMKHTGQMNSTLAGIALFLSALYLIDIFCYIRAYLNVKSYMKVSFNTFKEKPSLALLEKSTYIDWLTLNDKHCSFASLVKNIERSFFTSAIYITPAILLVI